MPSPTLSARLFKLGVGLTLVIVGLGVTALLFIPYHRATETRAWTETPCKIVQSEQKEAHSGDLADLTYRVYIRYTYTVGGHEYSSSRVQRRTFAGEDDLALSYKTPHSSKAKELLDKYPVGETVCWVNPADPADTVLEHQSKAAIYTLWWPLLFAVGGAGIALSALKRGKPSANNVTESATTPPPSDPSSKSDSPSP